MSAIYLVMYSSRNAITSTIVAINKACKTTLSMKIVYNFNHYQRKYEMKMKQLMALISVT